MRQDKTVEFSPSLLQALHTARHIAVLTGAGISAESGVPTFQGGFWGQYSPEELATPEGFQKQPKLVWDWYGMRRNQLKDVQPNPGHAALAAMQQRVPKFTLITQNIDGLHQKAGNHGVIELHGSIHRVKCFQEGTLVEHWDDSREQPPRCAHCGAFLRPDVVWFGEMLPQDAIEAAQIAADDCDVFFSIGTATHVYPAAALPFDALHNGATVIEINPDITPLSTRATHSLRGSSGQILPQLVKAVWD